MENHGWRYEIELHEEEHNLTTKHQLEPRESPQSNNKPQLENAFQDIVRPGRKSMDAKRELSAQPKASERTSEYKEQGSGGIQERDKVTGE